MYIRLVSIGLLLMATSLLPQRDTSVRVEHVEPPIYPVNTVATGLVVVEVDVERMTGKMQTRVLCGEPPFVTSAVEALAHWRFIVPADVDVGRTSVTFLFRPPAMHPVKVGAGAIWPWNLDKDFPALPQDVIDPGYPPASLATGAAVLEVQVSASGAVTGTKIIDGVEPLTREAKAAVKKWRFSPARVSGKFAPGTAFVVISFVLPA